MPVRFLWAAWIYRDSNKSCTARMNRGPAAPRAAACGTIIFTFIQMDSGGAHEKKEKKTGKQVFLEKILENQHWPITFLAFGGCPARPDWMLWLLSGPPGILQHLEDGPRCGHLDVIRFLSCVRIGRPIKTGHLHTSFWSVNWNI